VFWGFLGSTPPIFLKNQYISFKKGHSNLTPKKSWIRPWLNSINIWKYPKTDEIMNNWPNWSSQKKNTYQSKNYTNIRLHLLIIAEIIRKWNCLKIAPYSYKTQRDCCANFFIISNNSLFIPFLLPYKSMMKCKINFFPLNNFHFSPTLGASWIPCIIYQKNLNNFHIRKLFSYHWNFLMLRIFFLRRRMRVEYFNHNK